MVQFECWIFLGGSHLQQREDVNPKLSEMRVLPICLFVDGDARAAAKMCNGANTKEQRSINISQKVNFAELTHFVDRISHLVLTQAAGQGGETCRTLVQQRLLHLVKCR